MTALLKKFLIFIYIILAVGCSGTLNITSKPLTVNTTIPLKNKDLDEEMLKKWGSLDLVLDTVPGMSVDRAYNEIIKKTKGETVIVGVIDSGIDIEHEDLDGVLWENKKEIKGNGIDDDKNGYVDDVFGWNFLGKSEDENLEFVRIIKKLKPKYGDKTLASVDENDKNEYQKYIESKAEFEEKFQEANRNKVQYEQIYQQTKSAHEKVSEILKKEEYTAEELSSINDKNPETQQYVMFLSQMFNFIDPGDTVSDFIKNIKEGIEYFTDQLNYNLNPEFDGRSIVGDNVDDIKDVPYGNNKVMGPNPEKEGIEHGTHVAGIIAAERNNGIGLNGVANHVKIMSIRAVPNGDEYDKDIALAIRYAVDNGAKVINTSFGKYYSTHPEWVWDAIKYAAKKDVLIVNAAGNEGFDIDKKAVYPNDQPLDSNEIADNFITIGALNYTYGNELVASFSNYGKQNVDLFAPGVKIWSSTPKNSYEFLQGTSMAAPAVAGVAAVVRSYFPKLKANQIKKILMDSGLSIQSTVKLGDDPTNSTKFSKLSSSGKIANLYNALILANQVANGK